MFEGGWLNNIEFEMIFVHSLQSPDGKYLASGAIDGIINIFDIATGKLLHTLEGVVHHFVQTGLSDHKGRLTLSLKCY